MKIEEMDFHGKTISKIILTEEELNIIQKATSIMDAITPHADYNLFNSSGNIYRYPLWGCFIIESENHARNLEEENLFNAFENAMIEFTHNQDYCGEINAYTEKQMEQLYKEYNS